MPHSIPRRSARTARYRVALQTFCLGAAGLLGGAITAQAAPPPPASSGGFTAAPVPGALNTPQNFVAPTNTDTRTGGFFNAFTQRDSMLGDMGGLRTVLGQYGISLGLTDTEEVLGNATGGMHQGAGYDGLTTATLQLDTQKAFGWEGGLFNVSALQIHGRDLGGDNLGTLLPASGIASDRTTRLWELWYQQSFLNNLVDVKVGQQSLDQEFIVSSNALLFVNTGFGWPMLPSSDLPGGGPAYPLSALGARVRAQFTPQFTGLLGLFNGSPTARFNTGDAQQRNATGTSFPLNGGALLIGELQYSFPGNGGMVTPDSASMLPGTYKIGFWWDSEPFADQNLDNTGVSLASLDTNGTALARNGNWSIYAVMDQAVWRLNESGSRMLNVFARVMGAPGDRNLIGFSANAGVTLSEPIPGRDEDTLGVGFGYATVGKAASDFDKEVQRVTGQGFRRSAETMIEVTYQAKVTNWMQLQPDFQYVWNPGAGVANPNDPTQKLHNEAIFGLRTNITF